MSAFVHAPSHLRALVGAWVALHPSGRVHFKTGGRDLSPSDPEDWQRAFDALALENALSVAARYREEPEPVSGVVTSRDVCIPVSDVKDIARLLKAIDSYEYQSCEHEGWATSSVAAFCNQLRHALYSRLPGYQDGDGWAIQGEPNPENVVSLFAMARGAK